MKLKKSYLFLLLTLLASCKGMEEKEPTHQFILKHTWPEVLAIAQKHGVDSTYIPYDKQSSLMLDDEAEIVRFVLATKKSLDTRSQRREFMRRTIEVRNFSDYESLLNEYPLFLEQQKHAYGQKYDQWLSDQRKGQWHIYRDSIGALGWVRPENDPGHYGNNMERIDNKPSAKR
jgi:hypothetical protein